jgi:hypothetical protein
MKLKSNVRFLSYMKQGTNAPQVVERYTGNPWVYFGANNLFPEAMRTLADNCVPLSRCVEMAAMFISGDGIKFKDREGNELEAAQKLFQSWLADTTEEAFLYATAMDVALLNTLSWQVRRAAGAGIVRLDHIDVSRIRAAEMKDRRIPAYWFSSDWSRVGTRGGAEDRYRPIEIPAYDPKKPAPIELWYAKTYKQGRDYYGEPWYLSAVPDCEVWAKVPVFNRTQIDTGFKPTIHLHLPYSGDPKEVDKVIDDIRDAYTGANAEGLFCTFGLPGEVGATLTPIERGDRAGELDLIRDNAERVIVRGYGVPDILYRMDTTGGLTSQGSALKAAMDQFQSTFVEPKQKLITRSLVKLLNDAGMADVWEAEIEELEVFEEESYTEKIMLTAMTVNEIRDEMDMPPLDDDRGLMIPSLDGAASPGAQIPAEQNSPDTEDQ